MTLDQLFAQFIKEKEFLDGQMPKSITALRCAYKKYTQLTPHTNIPTKDDLIEFVVKMRATLKPVSCNSYIKSMRSFVKWMRENDYLT